MPSFFSPALILAVLLLGAGIALRYLPSSAESARSIPAPVLDEPSDPQATSEVAVLASSGFFRPGRASHRETAHHPPAMNRACQGTDCRLALASLVLDRNGAEPIAAQQHPARERPHILAGPKTSASDGCAKVEKFALGS
jgi:hypothetical protein